MKSALAVFAVLSVPSLLNAGVVMVNSHESFQSGEQPTTTKVFVDSDRVRIETEGEFGRSVMIFSGRQADDVDRLLPIGGLIKN